MNNYNTLLYLIQKHIGKTLFTYNYTLNKIWIISRTRDKWHYPGY